MLNGMCYWYTEKEQTSQEDPKPLHACVPSKKPVIVGWHFVLALRKGYKKGKFGK